MFDELKKEVCEQNLRLTPSGLVILTEGNVSQISDDRKYVAIKPSGVIYSTLTPDKIVIVDMKGIVIDGSFNPSTDLPTHLEIYRNFRQIGGITHTHSISATTFAQMKKQIICSGTTHADAHFKEIPITRDLTDGEIENDYEVNIGKTIAEILDSAHSPFVLVASHGPFSFGKNAKESVDYACILEKIATMALLSTSEVPIQKSLLKKHFYRKHGKNSYYGQDN